MASQPDDGPQLSPQRLHEFLQHLDSGDHSQQDLSPQERQQLDRIRNAMDFIDQVRSGSHPELLDNLPQWPKVTGNTSPVDITGQSTQEIAANQTLAGHQPPRSGTWDFRDRYQIVRTLAQGGFANVYLATDRQLDRPVALKVLRIAERNSEEALSRFQREARAVATLDHPGIVPIFEYGIWQGAPFFAAAYCQGGSLQQWLERHPGPQSGQVMLQVMLPLLEAVQHAHHRGMVHRDLKPANIFLADHSAESDAPGTILLGDFGLVRQMEGEASLQTVEGAIVGTPAYMAPEQASGKFPVSPATDVFSLGVILYELITGQLPFAGKSHVDLLLALTTQPVPRPRQHIPNIDRDLEAICLKCLEPLPKDRYPSAFELLEDLKRWQATVPVQARKVNWVQRSWKWVQRNPVPTAALACFAFLLALATSQWYLARQQTQRAEQQLQRANEQAAQKDDYSRQTKIMLDDIVASVGNNENIPSEYRRSLLKRTVKSQQDFYDSSPGDSQRLRQLLVARWWLANFYFDMEEMPEVDQELKILEAGLQPFLDDPAWSEIIRNVHQLQSQTAKKLDSKNEMQQATDKLLPGVTQTVDPIRLFHLALGNYNQQTDESRREALTYFAQAEDAFRDSPHPQHGITRVRNHFFWGRTLMELGDFEQAIQQTLLASNILTPVTQSHGGMEGIMEDAAKIEMQLGEIRLWQLRKEGLPVATDHPDLIAARSYLQKALEIYIQWRDRNPRRDRSHGLACYVVEFQSHLEHEQQDLARLQNAESQYLNLVSQMPLTNAMYDSIRVTQFDVHARCLELMQTQAPAAFPKRWHEIYQEFLTFAAEKPDAKNLDRPRQALLALQPKLDDAPPTPKPIPPK